MSSSDTADSLHTIQLSTETINDVETSTLNFRQRQSDVFAALANLEAAHNEVTKATKEERKLIRKTAWKQTVAAPENLVEQKECRDKILKRNSLEDMANFRRPAIPANRRSAYQRRDPNKWTHYSLADVDEDGPIGRPGADSNASLAMAFINEIRERNSRESAQSEEDKNPQNRRILFRPTHGTKKPRLDEVKQSDSTVSPVAVACRLDDDDLQGEEHPTHSARPNASSGTGPVFVHRQRQLRQRDLSDVDDKEDPVSVSETSADEVEETSDSEILLNDLDQMEQDVEEDHSEDHLF